VLSQNVGCSFDCLWMVTATVVHESLLLLSAGWFMKHKRVHPSISKKIFLTLGANHFDISCSSHTYALLIDEVVIDVGIRGH